MFCMVACIVLESLMLRFRLKYFVKTLIWVFGGQIVELQLWVRQMIVLVPSLDQCPMSSRLAPPWSVIYVLLSHMLVDITFIYLANNQQSILYRPSTVHF